jgi:L-lysine 2,3-aminomutase
MEPAIFELSDIVGNLASVIKNSVKELLTEQEKMQKQITTLNDRISDLERKEMSAEKTEPLKEEIFNQVNKLTSKYEASSQEIMALLKNENLSTCCNCKRTRKSKNKKKGINFLIIII